MTPGRMPPPRPPSGGGAKPAGMPPPTAHQEESAGDSGKYTHEECLFVNADQHCGNCKNYSAEDGSCAVVEGQMDLEDACLRFFESGEQEEQVEPDGDEGAEMPAPGADNEVVE